MPRRRQNALNRGRIQAQGGGLEKSRSWTMETIPTKPDGHNYIKELKDELTPTELSVRTQCFERATKWVNNAPSKGYVAVTPIMMTFKPSPPMKDIRVDGEIHSGAAFKDANG